MDSANIFVLYYRVTHPPNVDYTNVPAQEVERDDLHSTLKDHLAVFKIKMPCASRKDACSLVAFLLCTFLFGACNARQDTVVVEGLTLDVNRQQVGERIWADVSLVPLHELPMEPDVYLVRPQTIKVDANGNVYVMDWGDMTVKRFNADGEYMTTYGSGVGSAPGELTSLFDMGALGDTIVYVLDKSAGRISLFASGGAFVETIPVPATYHRHVVTAAGRSYSMSRGAANFVTSLGSDEKGFGNTLLEGQRENHFMLLDGFITTYGENMVYLPLYFPVIIQFDENGEYVYARTTPDFGYARPPKTTSPQPGFTGLDAELLQGFPVADGDRINVYSRADTSAIDIYDAPTGDYRYSIAVPLGLSLMRQDRVYHRRDTTIAVYAVEW